MQFATSGKQSRVTTPHTDVTIVLCAGPPTHRSLMVTQDGTSRVYAACGRAATQVAGRGPGTCRRGRPAAAESSRCRWPAARHAVSRWPICFGWHVRPHAVELKATSRLEPEIDDRGRRYLLHALCGCTRWIPSCAGLHRVIRRPRSARLGVRRTGQDRTSAVHGHGLDGAGQIAAVRRFSSFRRDLSAAGLAGRLPRGTFWEVRCVPGSRCRELRAICFAELSLSDNAREPRVYMRRPPCQSRRVGAADGICSLQSRNGRQDSDGESYCRLPSAYDYGQKRSCRAIHDLPRAQSKLADRRSLTPLVPSLPALAIIASAGQPAEASAVWFVDKDERARLIALSRGI
jgi:hypothetical protein